MARYVFVSYSRRDSAYVRKLVEFLRKQKFDVWADDQIPTGERWVHTIRTQIDGCAAFVPIMSPDADESEWVGEEIGRARAKGLPILPLLLKGGPIFGLGQIQHYPVLGGVMPGNQFLTRLRDIVGPIPRPQEQQPGPVGEPADKPKQQLWILDPWALGAAAFAGLAADATMIVLDRTPSQAAITAVVTVGLAFMAYTLASALTRR
jgi:hypothetical protein